jgi:hypothetical protein
MIASQASTTGRPFNQTAILFGLVAGIAKQDTFCS